MSKYPIFVELKNRRVVVIGGGQVALRKAQALSETQCQLVVVTKTVCADLEALCRRCNAELILGPYRVDHLRHAMLVVAATNLLPLNKQIYLDCQSRQILCNIVDQPDLCDFYVPAIVKQGSLQIAVSTNGASPAFASHVRQKLELMFTDKHGAFLDLLLWAREQTLAHLTGEIQKKALSRELAGGPSFNLFVTEGAEAWRAMAEQKMTEARDSG